MVPTTLYHALKPRGQRAPPQYLLMASPKMPGVMQRSAPMPQLTVRIASTVS